MPQDLLQYFQYSPFFVDAEMMSDLAWEKLQDKIDKIPISLYNLLVDSKTSEVIEGLNKKYIQLSVQGPDVARLIRDVVIADVFLGDMPQEIQRRLGLDPAMAREVANLIVAQVFVPVLEELKQVHRQEFPNRISQSTPSNPPRTVSPSDNLTGQAHQQHQGYYQGEELPESGGNIINLRQN